LVRLSPLQFSLSVSIVVIGLGAAGLAGYYYGLKQVDRQTDRIDVSSTGSLHEGAGSKPDTGGTEASVTFYSALTEPRKDVPPAPPPQPVETPRTQVVEKPAVPAVSAPRISDPIPGSGSVMLQVASYKDQLNARKLLQDLSSEGYAGTVVRAELGERGVWFRVRVGPYKSVKESEAVLKKLREERKLKGYIVK
jgi:cell division septation protein DedD